MEGSADILQQAWHCLVEEAPVYAASAGAGRRFDAVLSLVAPSAVEINIQIQANSRVPAGTATVASPDINVSHISIRRESFFRCPVQPLLCDRSDPFPATGATS